MRADLKIISEWIEPGSRVLDLGCGDGTLLAALQAERSVTGYGLEIDPDSVAACIRAGVNVIQSDLDAGLSDFDAESFDYVVMTQALQAVQHPDQLILEMLRIGRQGIVTFPNFGHWRSRTSIGLHGKMPVTPALPETWYNTENIHLCTFKDFEALCAKQGIEILQRMAVDRNHRIGLRSRVLPNLFGEIALYRFARQA